MDERLINVLEKRRLAAGAAGRPLPYDKWGKELGIMYTSLFRFVKGQRALSINAIRTLSERARADNDTELLHALVHYATGVDVQISLN